MGTANTLGVQFEKASSWLAVISARTREAPESIGTGLKSIMARYQQLTEKGYAEEDGTKVNNVAKALSVIGIKMTDAEGNFRNFGDVMDELGGKWGSLDNRTKSYISTCLAGTYQLSRFQNLMEGYGESVKLYENALNSAGTTQKKYNLWMKGTEAYLNGLKEEGTDIWRKVFDSEMLKRFIKTLTDSLKLVNLLIDKFGVLPTGIMTVSIVLSALNKNFRINVAQKWFDFLDRRIVGTRRKIQMTNKTINGLKVAKAKDVLTVFGTPVKDINLKNIINGVGKQMKKMQLQVKKTRLEFQKAKAESGRLSGGLKVLKTSAGATTAKMKALAQSIKLTKLFVGGLKIAMTAGLSIAFDMIVDKIYKTIHRTQELREKLEDLEQTALSNIDNNNNNIRSLSEVSDEYNKLKKETSLSTDEQKRLHEIENQIANIMPEVVTGIDEQGNAMINLKGGIEGVVEALKEKNKQEKLALAGSWSDKQKQLQDDIAKEKKKIEKDKAKMKEALKQIEKGEAGRSKFSAKGDTGRVMYHEDQIEKGKTKVAELNAKIQESTSKIKELNAEAIPYANVILEYTEGYDNLTDSAKKLMSILAKPKGVNFKVTDAEKLMKIFSDNRIKETIKKLENLKMHPESVKNFNEELEKTVLLLLNLIKELSGGKINLDVQDIMNAFNLKEVNEELDKIKEKIKSFSDARNDLKEYSEYIKEINKNGYLSADSMAQIIENHEELIPYLIGEGNLYDKLIEMQNKEKDNVVKSIMVKLEANEVFFQNVMQGNVALFNQLKELYGKDIENFKTMADAKKAINDLLIKAFTEQWSTYYKSEEEGLQAIVDAYEKGQQLEKEGKYNPYKDGSITKEKYKKAKAMLELQKQMNKSMDNAKAKLEELDFTSQEYGETLDKNKELIDAITHSLKDLESQIKELDFVLHKQESRMKRMVKGSKEYRDALKEETDLLKEKVSLMEQGIDTSENGINSLYGTAVTQMGNSVGEQVVATAQKYLGTPYVWGGESPRGFDCSGLVKYVYQQVGVQLNRTSQQQFQQGTPISKSRLVAGDLVFFKTRSGSASAPGHVGIALGNGQFIHAPRTGDVVKIASLDSRQDFVGGRRILGNNSISVSGNSLDGKLGGALKGHWQDFVKAGQKYGVDPYLLASITTLESGRGTSSAIRNHNNPGGIMDWNNNWKTIKHFGSLREGIEYTAKNLKTTYINQGLHTIEQIGRKYAPIGASNDPNGTNKNWIPQVKSIYEELTGKAYTGSPVAGGGGDDLFNEIDSLRDRILGYKRNIFDLKEQLKDTPKLMYESFIEEFENHIKVIDSKVKKVQVEKDLQTKDSHKYIQLFKEEAKLENDKIARLKEEKKYVDEELKNKDKLYDNNTIFQMKEKSRELELTIKDVVKSVKEVNFAWVDAQLENINQRLKENADLLENALSRLSLDDNKHLVEQLKIKSQILDLDKDNVIELNNLIRELTEEQMRTNADYLYDKIKELNGELDKANTQLDTTKKELKEIRNAMGNIIETIEDKLKEVIQKNNENYKKSLEKRLKLFEQAIDEQVKKLEEAENRLNRNKTESDDAKRIFELQQKLTRAELNDSVEGKDKKLQIEKELNDAIIQQKENQVKYEIESRKDSLQKAKDEYNKYLDKYNEKVEESTNDRNLSFQVYQALMNGYITTFDGVAMDLKSALMSLVDTSDKAFSSMGNKIKTELIDNLSEVRNIFKEFNTLDVTRMNLADKPTKKVYGTGVDLENAKRILGIEGNKFVDTNLVDNNKIALTSNDVVLGNSLAKHDLHGARRIQGKNRYGTENLLRNFIQELNHVNTVYGTGADLSNAQKYLGKFGYKFVDTNDVRNVDLKPTDIVVGGGIIGKEKVIRNNAKWLWGRDRYATANEISTFAKWLESMKGKLKGFSSGGVVDYTGLAMVHGGNGHDELMLNNNQVASLYNFIKNIPQHMQQMFKLGVTMPNMATPNGISFRPSNQSKTIEGDKYEIDINVNGDLVATKEKGKEFGEAIMNRIKKRG